MPFIYVPNAKSSPEHDEQGQKYWPTLTKANPGMIVHHWSKWVYPREWENMFNTECATLNRRWLGFALVPYNLIFDVFERSGNSMDIFAEWVENSSIDTAACYKSLLQFDGASDHQYLPTDEFFAATTTSGQQLLMAIETICGMMFEEKKFRPKNLANLNFNKPSNDEDDSEFDPSDYSRKGSSAAKSMGNRFKSAVNNLGFKKSGI